MTSKISENNNPLPQVTIETKKPLRPSQRRWLEKLVAYVDAHLDNREISVMDLALATCVSERQLYRKLKRYTGMTPNAFLRSRRLARAKHLIDQGQARTMTELAEQVGYHRSDYFTHLFKEEYGSHPADLHAA